MDDGADLGERTVGAELQLAQDVLEGDACRAGGEVRAFEAEADRAGRPLAGGRQPQQLRLGIDKAAYQPGARQPIGPKRLDRGPGAAMELLARADVGRRVCNVEPADLLVRCGDGLLRTQLSRRRE